MNAFVVHKSDQVNLLIIYGCAIPSSYPSDSTEITMNFVLLLFRSYKQFCILQFSLAIVSLSLAEESCDEHLEF